MTVVGLKLFSCDNPSAADFIPSPQVSEAKEISSLAIGSRAPDFDLPATDGKWYNLNDFRADVLVIAFISNSCPYSQVCEERLIDFFDEYRDKGVDLVAISPNSPLSLPDDAVQYSDLDDSYGSMKLRASNQRFNFPYLYDGDDQAVSIAFGPKVIPTVYIFDKNRRLQYRGRIDYSPVWRGANADDLRLAVDAVLRDGEILRRERDSQGCKVYWSWDQEDRENLEQKWQDAPVTLKRISLDSLKTILVNFSSKPRVINFWATWCGPCKKEFPEFLRMRRMYYQRPVELISVSLDEPAQFENALTFLEQLHAPGTNYLIDDDDKEAIRQNVYPDWEGTLPFTIIVEPLGELYRVWQGPFDANEVRKAIIDHRLLGRYIRY